ncbi:hypothetical protein GYMLUDRAFT_62355 [Collybiopsis luxurians FD-317 M1]|uniref:Unplaced genomic scaffold GYMLUscaffold_55, whole genome shotgun sequence n=1 Tax=Collybiopsis luxurians FD-317 M1 TaxID=944289 RepID=A0A0D0AYM5_9AGAR|nr:hypothetical protein GYMLUDRAFT_62355 [Collybiopsis luxurians FD-317 M1]
MPVMTPSTSPPLSQLSETLSHLKISFPNDDSSQTQTQISEKPTRLEVSSSIVPKIPRIHVDMDVIPDVVAAKLATSLLGHVLFLKNQIPFPVLQLARLPSAKSDSRPGKLRRDLIDSFDTLSSHLDTTFTALSTTFARCKPPLNAPEADRKATNPAFMAILVGPSIGTAKSKVIFAVDDLEAKIWGLRGDVSRTRENDDGEQESDPDESFDDDEEGGELDDSEESGSSEDDDASSSSSSGSSQRPQPPSPPRRIPSVEEHAQQQKRIRVADQLLSRALAVADAEGRGMASELGNCGFLFTEVCLPHRDFISAPTQTHVLLRAPRRFSHPAWIPRPNFTNMMEQTLHDFLEETRLVVDTSADAENKPKNKRSAQKQKIEGVRVSGRTTSPLSALPPMNGTCAPIEQSEECQRQEEREEAEADEMIWWSWDGKLVGFSSW